MRGDQNTPAVTHIKDLTADPTNRRLHNPRNIGMVVDALHQVGAARSIVIDEDNVILAGNGVTEAAAAAGITRVRVIEADGQELIAVRRSGLTAEQKRALAIYDNRTAELATWDIEQLAADLRNGQDLSAFFLEDELKTLLASAEGLDTGQTDPDEVPPARATGIRPGDLFELGTHRLLCGDSREMGAAEAVMGGTPADGMWTDAPFGVSYIGKTSEALVVHVDRESDLAPLLRDAFAAADRVLAPGAAVYLAHPAGRNAVVFGQAFLDVGWHWHQGLVWVKDSMVLGHSDYQFEHEPIMYGWKKGANRAWLSDRTEVTVFVIDRPKVSRDHPTTKPVELVVRQIGNNVPPQGVIFEPFAGSGTTLIAAQQLRISCRAIELSPAYCQVIIDRWEAFVGHGAKAVKVGSAHTCHRER